jgi:hypothetical protein
VFDNAFAESLLQQHGTRLSADHPECWALATEDKRRAQREWVNATLTRLREPGRGKVFAHLLNRNRFTQSYNELATAGILIDAAYNVEYEPVLHGQTPDLALYSAGGSLRLIVEVANRLLPSAVDRAARRWERLPSRVQRIPVPSHPRSQVRRVGRKARMTR